MMLIPKPKLKVLDKNKLHVSRRPGCIAWFLLGLSALISHRIFTYLTSNICFLIILSLGEIIFVLNSIGEWEDLILHRQENEAIIKRCIWSDKLRWNRSDDLFTMRLTDIRQIGIFDKIGLFILHRNGRIIILNMRGLMTEEIQSLRKEINYFINMSRLKHLDYSPIDPSDRLLLASDSEEYLQNLPETCLPMSNELTVSNNILSGDNKYYRIQQNLSFPSLIRETRFNNYQLAKSRKCRYTENSTYSNNVKHTRNIYDICIPHDLLKLNEKRD